MGGNAQTLKMYWHDQQIGEVILSQNEKTMEVLQEIGHEHLPFTSQLFSRLELLYPEISTWVVKRGLLPE